MQSIEEKLNNVNPHWSKDLIIRYVIVELAPYFQRDLFYFLSSPQKQYKLFYGGYRPIAPNVFCVTLCEAYQKVLARFDIRSKVIQASKTEEGKVPLFALIVEGDNGWYYINPLKDLWSHQLGVSSDEYGIIGFSNHDFVLENYPYLQMLTSAYVSELSSELGLPNNDALFGPDVIGGKDLNQYRKRKGMDPKAPYTETVVSKIEDIGNSYLNIGAVHGPIERNLMYKYFFITVFTKPEKSLVKLSLDPNQNFAITIDVDADGEKITYQEQKDENDHYSLLRK